MTPIMNYLNLLVVAVAVSFVTGCASQMVWYQDGKTFAEADRDLRECKFEAVKHGYVQASPFGDPIASGAAAGVEQAFRQNDIMRSCMNAKGYRLVSRNQIATPARLPSVSTEAIREPAKVDTAKLIRAAEANGSEAQARLADFLYTGKHGLSTNRVEAYKWARLAMSQGNASTKDLVWEMELFLTPEELSQGKAAADEFLQRK